ncbi:hypothetical protein POJ06DRAFT_249749 [Lipomyces tetrasporus]|uniref:DUF1765-domain-containing protein n=1 Tax=Lipomyces tetrasporus TaxID=54092 RepID=A0AAD7VTL9_9ASCO|nr:uncharacterized protein POJ06DRAFT_249749 [Lipomyces tetrasporus]KAJ8100884.1 hypothetical protein POJ06DRAFT_249749 [Lipomyces tetrasporus]
MASTGVTTVYPASAVPPQSPAPAKCALPVDPESDASLLYMIAAAAAGTATQLTDSSISSPSLLSTGSPSSSRSSSRSSSPCPPCPEPAMPSAFDAAAPEPVHHDKMRRQRPPTRMSSTAQLSTTTAPTPTPTPTTDSHPLRCRSSPTLSVTSSASSLLSSRASSLFFKSSSTVSSASSSPPSSSSSSVLNFWAVPTQSVPSYGATARQNGIVDKRLQSFWTEEFRILESDLQKFTTRQAVYKANVLRVSVLPFLRNHGGEQTSRTVTVTELERRVYILHRWWTALIAGLRERLPHAVAAQDRAAYYETIFGILARDEWRLVTSKGAVKMYHDALLDTVKLALTRLLMKPVAVNIAVFAGAVLAHAFFYVPGIAGPLLYLLRARQAELSRVRRQSGFATQQLRSLLQPASTVLPPNLSSYIGVSNEIFTTKPDAPAAITDEIYGPWVHRWWGAQDSDVFASFVKHYYSIMSDYVGPVATVCECTPDEALLAGPGIFYIHAVILRHFDSLVHRSHALVAAQTQTINEVNLSSATLGTAGYPSTSQLSRMRILIALKEILESKNPTCASYASTYARFFESSVMHAVAKRTAVFDADACVALCDLSEVVLFVLAGNTRKEELNWGFWLDVCKRMLTSESSMTEVRTWALLYVLWDHLASAEEYGAVDWVLSDEVWNRHFCHWAPLVRAYYMRLLCWRVIRQSSPQREAALERFHGRLSELHTAVRNAAAKGVRTSGVPCSPVPGRRLGIVQCSGQDSPAHLFFLSSLLSVPVPGLTKSVNRYDVHDEDVFIVSSTSSSAASSPSASPTSPNGDYFSNGKSFGNMLRRLKSFRNSFVATSPPASPGHEPPTTLSPESSPTEMRRRMSVSTVSSSYSAASTATAYTMSLPSDSSTPDRRRSEKTYCFTLQPSDQHRQQAAVNPRGSSLPPGAHIPNPRAPFARHFAPSHKSIKQSDSLEQGLPQTALTYAGRALSEWNLTVRQFERFVEMRRTRDGVDEADIGTPSVIGESF